MASASMFAAFLKDSSPAQVRAAIAQFLPVEAPLADRVATVEQFLRSEEGAAVRQELGRWIVDQLVPVEALLPEKFAIWREPTRESMLFVISRLSIGRLAPKIVEQIDLPATSTPETRLLKLITRVPGLQKLGQVLARNRHLRQSVRRALAKLENGIRDVPVSEVLVAAKQELGERVGRYEVRMNRKLLSEASVSAVVRFTWWNGAKRRREKGVLKVLKPHIPECFAEDMQILQDLADFFGKRAHEGFSSAVIPDTFSKIRQHLQREVDFMGEQSALGEAARQFRNLPGVRVPRLIPELCTTRITAMSEEEGVKVTVAAARLSPRARTRLSQQLVEAVVAFPLLSSASNALFHADPHAGNLLYNRRTGDLVLLDWALAERLTREQRRRLALLFAAVSLRNPAAAALQIEELSEQSSGRGSHEAEVIRKLVGEYMATLPLAKFPRVIDAMRLLEEAALIGVRFPSALILFSKVLFTLDGILEDIRRGGVTAEITIAQYFLKRWARRPFSLALPLGLADWWNIECSALLYGGRCGIRAEEALTRRLLSSLGSVKANVTQESSQVTR